MESKLKILLLVIIPLLGATVILLYLKTMTSLGLVFDQNFLPFVLLCVIYSLLYFIWSFFVLRKSMDENADNFGFSKVPLLIMSFPVVLFGLSFAAIPFVPGEYHGFFEILFFLPFVYFFVMGLYFLKGRVSRIICFSIGQLFIFYLIAGTLFS